MKPLNALILVIVAVLFFAGNGLACGNELNVSIEPLYGKGLITVTSTTTQEKSILVKHEIKGKDVYIETTVQHVTLTKEKGTHVDGEGHFHLYVDDNLIDSIYRSSFVMKGLPKGNHTIKLELVQNDDKSYGVEDEFSISITE